MKADLILPHRKFSLHFAGTSILKRNLQNMLIFLKVYIRRLVFPLMLYLFKLFIIDMFLRMFTIGPRFSFHCNIQ